ncbi:hypothetical protein RJT34_18049 [Clitoria ternatea]|uniref:Uncharacterized protein n=1 Tax=Clitoria ternatea TaxID=43366 RepID=A0AAN9PF21_CLITE
MEREPSCDALPEERLKPFTPSLRLSLSPLSPTAMLRRNIYQISSSQIARRNPGYFINQIPSHQSPRNEFSTSSKPGSASPPGSLGKRPESSGFLSMLFIGIVVVGAAFLAAYQAGNLDQYLKKEHHTVPQAAPVNATAGNLKGVQHSADQLVSPTEKLSNENPTVELAQQKIDTHFPQPEIAVDDRGGKPVPVQEKSSIDEVGTADAKENQWPQYTQSTLTSSAIAEVGTADAKENQLPEHTQSTLASDDPSKESLTQSDGIIDIKSTKTENTPILEEGIQHTSTSRQTSAVLDENGVKNIQLEIQETEERGKIIVLCISFYARSEEARQSHATQNFALRALALEDALPKGLPIQTQIASLESYLEGRDKDSVFLVLAFHPEETQNNGTDTQLQLLKQLLAGGKLAEAADYLEENVRGTQAAEIVAGWVRQARNRAISEQAVVLQSYAHSLCLT